MRNFIAVALVLAAAGPAFAGDRRVGKGQTYETIQAAVDAAAPGDRIVVLPGVYPENVVVTTDRLAFVGKKAVWDGTTGPGLHGNCLSGQANGISVQGFAFRAGTGHVELGGDDVVIRRCVSTGAQYLGFSITGRRARVEQCTVRGAAGNAVLVLGEEARVLRNRVTSCSSGVRAQGDGAAVEGNTLLGTSGHAILVEGDGTRTVKNRVTNAYSAGITVQGDGAYVGSNRVAHTDSTGVEVSGREAVVERNTVVGSIGTGVYVSGDEMRVSRNVVSQTVDDSDAYSLTSGGGEGGGTVERNSAVDCIQRGFYVGTRGVAYTANQAVRTGSENDGGWYVAGDGNTFTSCVATDGDSVGFFVSGTGNVLRTCKATVNTSCGFVVYGNENVLDRCTSLGHPAEGVVNRGSATDLLGGTYLGNRLDVTCDGMASWDEWEPPKFKTGGKDHLPLVN